MTSGHVQKLRLHIPRLHSGAISASKTRPAMTETPMDRYSAPPSTSLSLLEQARKHDNTAWVLLVKLYSPLVYGWCRTSGLSPDNAEEIGQEVFFAVFTSLIHFHKEKPEDTFRGWLRRIVRNKCVDHFNSAKKQPTAFGGDIACTLFQEIPNGDDESDVASSETQFLYARAFQMIQSEFNSTDVAAFLQFVGHERPAKELSPELGISENQVYLAKSRILKRLRQVFSDLLPEVDENDQSLAG
jgi:RNA polymerase sigma-70 factor (ECF subfamily)